MNRLTRIARLAASLAPRAATQFATVFAVTFLLVVAANAQPIKLGELNSYKTFPAFLDAYKKGMELAVERNQRKRRPAWPSARVGHARRQRQSRRRGTRRRRADRAGKGRYSDGHIFIRGRAGGGRSRQAKPGRCSSQSEPLTDKIVWDNGNKYTFRLRPSTYMQTAMLVPDAARLGKKRWVIVYPDYEYGKSATAAFKQQMIARQASGIEFVEVAVPLGKIDAGPVVQAMIDAKPDAIFSSLFATDLAKFRARRRIARAVQRPTGLQSARRRARISGPAEG